MKKTNNFYDMMFLILSTLPFFENTAEEENISFGIRKTRV